MTATVTEPVVITGPGVYNQPAEEYHAHRDSLSHSGAKLLLSPSCPAKFRHQMDHGRKPSKAFDYGHAAHRHVLGIGEPLVVVDAPDWRTKLAQQARDEAYAVGAVPILVEQHSQVVAMARALMGHPLASKLLERDTGTPEQSAFWTDGPTGITRRCRFDWLPDDVDGRRLLVPDYKTCASAAPAKLDRVVADFGYHSQAAWYLDAVEALGLGENPIFLFIFQEKEPPFVVTVVELDAAALRIGRERNRTAIEIYARCVETNHWPAYADDPVVVSLPPWVENAHIQDHEESL